jgi:hypothetical protein
MRKIISSDWMQRNFSKSSVVSDQGENHAKDEFSAEIAERALANGDGLSAPHIDLTKI